MGRKSKTRIFLDAFTIASAIGVGLLSSPDNAPFAGIEALILCAEANFSPIAYLFALLFTSTRQETWSSFLDTLGDCKTDDPRAWLPLTCATFVSFSLVYMINGALHLPLDLLASKRILDDAGAVKLQPAKRTTLLHVDACLPVVAGNIFLVILPSVACAFGFATRGGEGGGIGIAREVPAHSRRVYSMLVCIATNEVLFYYTHRVLHHQVLYSRVHFLHHRFASPFALAALFAHPAELFLCHILPITTALFLCSADFFFTLEWIVVAILNVQNDHSGFSFPWETRTVKTHPKFHDDHHRHLNVNFGHLGLLDALHGTLRKKREYLD